MRPYNRRGGYLRNAAIRFANDRNYNRAVRDAARAATVGVTSMVAAAGRKLYRKKKKQPAVVASNIGTARRIKTKKKRIVKKAPMSKLVADLSHLKKITDADTGTLIYRARTTGRVLAGVNQQSYASIVMNSTSTIETILAELRFFNPAVPGTLTQASGATGTYSRNFYFKNGYIKFKIRNNYQVPCRCVLYACSPKEDTDLTVSTAFTDGLADVGNPDNASPLVFLTDSPLFYDLWKINKSCSSILQPGEEMDYNMSLGAFEYNPADVDSHSLSYQKQYKASIYFVRVEGILGHDSTADEQGCLAGGIDWMADRTFTVEYPAGVNIKYIVVSNGADSFTNAALVSSKPVSDNIVYSVS